MLTIKNWSKTEYYIDEKEATISDIDNLFTILNCEKKVMKMKYYHIKTTCPNTC